MTRHINQEVLEKYKKASIEYLKRDQETADAIKAYSKALLSDFEIITDIKEKLKSADDSQMGVSALFPYILMQFEVHDLERIRDNLPEIVDAINGKGNTDNQWREVVEKAKEQYSSKHSKINRARELGAITTLNNHVATIADKMLKSCFTSDQIKKINGDIVLDQAGRLDRTNGELQESDLIHTGFLMALLQIANNYDVREYNGTTVPSVGVYLPAILREAGIDTRPRERNSANKKELKRRVPAISEKELKEQRLQAFLDFIKPLDGSFGRIEGEGMYAVAKFISWDESSEIAQIAIPYEMKLCEIAKLHSGALAIRELFKANILTEKQSAVELANCITVGLIERGITTPDNRTYADEKKSIKNKTITKTNADGTKEKTVITYQDDPEDTFTKSYTDDDGVTHTKTYHPRKPKTFTYKVKFSTLLKNCPQALREIEEVRNRENSKNRSRDVNKKLSDLFAAAIRIIEKKSEVPNYYKNIKITTVPYNDFKAPTNSTLNSYLQIAHEGKNPDFTE